MTGHSGSHSGTPRGGARGGARRAARPKRSFQPRLALLGLGALVALAAWGVLVWLAIDAGRSARGGDSGRWVFLALASVGAVGCLFLSLLLVTLLLRGVGVLEESERTRARRAAKAPHRH